MHIDSGNSFLTMFSPFQTKLTAIFMIDKLWGNVQLEFMQTFFFFFTQS